MDAGGRLPFPPPDVTWRDSINESFHPYTIIVFTHSKQLFLRHILYLLTHTNPSTFSLTHIHQPVHPYTQTQPVHPYDMTTDL